MEETEKVFAATSGANPSLLALKRQLLLTCVLPYVNTPTLYSMYDKTAHIGERVTKLFLSYCDTLSNALRSVRSTSIRCCCGVEPSVINWFWTVVLCYVVLCSENMYTRWQISQPLCTRWHHNSKCWLICSHHFQSSPTRMHFGMRFCCRVPHSASDSAGSDRFNRNW